MTRRRYMKPIKEAIWKFSNERDFFYTGDFWGHLGI